ncbi:Crp/Fnr family transcriptional regulator [Candidatus Riflebacteria bacterium]
MQEDYSKAVDFASKGDLKNAVDILSRCVDSDQNYHYNKFIVDIIDNFDETSLQQQITRDDDRLLEAIPTSLMDKFSKKFFKGEYIVRKGDPANSFFVIANGTVLITITGKTADIPIALNFMGEGEFFGEMALFVGGKRTANVITVSQKATLLEVSKPQLEVFIDKHPKFGMKMISTLCGRLSKTNQILSDLVDSGIYTDAREVLG